MFEVNVKLIGQLKGFVNRSCIVVKLDESSLKTLFKVLVERFGRKFKRTLMGPNNNNPKIYNIILVNDVEISMLQGLETKLHKKDVVTIIPITHGG
jgi:molybdopterin converting factor small subunit